MPASASASASRAYPQVDWSRYHLQILFVDRSDTVRGKLAAGIFERWVAHLLGLAFGTQLSRDLGH